MFKNKEKVVNRQETIETMKVWLESYQEGVPAEISPDAYANLVELFESVVHKFSDRVAFKNFHQTLTYKALEEETRRLAAFFQEKWNLEKGDKLAIMMPNVLQYPLALFAALRAGLTVVNVNPLYTACELKHLLQDSQAKAIVVLENFAHIVQEASADLPLDKICITKMGDMLGAKGYIINFVVKYIKKMVPRYHLPQAITLKSALSTNANGYKPVSLSGRDVAFLQYTGGTTGVSKGAMLTHRNLIANIEQAKAWLSATESMADSGSGIITALPLYHIFSLTANCFTFFSLGAANILITNPRDINGFVKILSKENFIAFTGVNTLFNALLHHPGFIRLDFSKLRFTLGGGMAVQSAVARKWKDVTGSVLLEAYGLTETSPAVCINPLYIEEFTGSIGLPISSTEVSIRDEHDQPCPFGEVGELCVKGPQVMLGYWNRPEETEKVLKSGWLHTGDMATMDEKGFVRIVDRIKDMVIVSGFNVYPNEVEDVLTQHPLITEAAVIGVADPNSGERVKAFIVRKDDTLTKEDIIKHCRTALTNYKVPKDIEFREELPKTNVGKVIRRALRDEEAIKSAQ